MSDKIDLSWNLPNDSPQTTLSLRALVCELLVKNERLRTALRRWELASVPDRTPLPELTPTNETVVEQAARVFVIDDEPIIAMTLAQLLLQQGYSALWFSDPLEALSAIALHVPDLIISDVTMPQLCGVDLAIHVKRSYPDCGILLISASAAYEDRLSRARNQGHTFRLLDKPVDPNHLIAEVRCMLWKAS